jgi:branched-chain amino acid transport system permease protein
MMAPYRSVLLVLAALALVPLVVESNIVLNFMKVALMLALAGTGWNLLGGYGGQFSFGHAVFFGTGAYTSTLLLQQTWLGVWSSPWVGMALGALLAALLSQIIGYPVFRLRGHYFAIATIAVGEIVQTIVINWDAVGGARGLFVPIKRPDSLVNFQFHESKQTYYYIALALLVLALGISRAIVRSRTGYYFRAIREDQDAAAALGIPVARYKQRAMAVSAALTALGGTFYAQYVFFIDPESVLPLSLSILVCLVAVLGGVGTLWGPILGAAILVPLGEITRVQFGGTGKALDLVIYGLLIMIVSVVQPGGIMALLQRGARRS